MKPGRVLPPAAAIVRWQDLAAGLAGLVHPAAAVRALEQEVRDHFGVPHVFPVSSGSAALTIALRALRTVPSRTEVIVPAFTCFSVPAAVVSAGLKPVLCDIDPETFDYDRAQLEQIVGAATVGVVSHHLFGIPSNVAATRAVCEPRGIAVVEDAAQAMGGTTADGRPLGTLGDVGILSVGRGKNVTAGSGGLILTGSETIATAVRREISSLGRAGPGATVRDFVRVTAMAALTRPSIYWVPAGIPALGLGRTVYPAHIPLHPMSGLQAGVLRHWPERLAESNAARRDTAAALEALVPEWIRRRPHTTYLRLPVLAASREERDHLLCESDRLGLGFGRSYPTPLDRIPQLRPLLDDRRFPAAAMVADRILTVPTHPFVTASDRQAIAACLDGTRRTARSAA